MKSKLATALSVTGVVITGTAAAAVNTQALQSRAEATLGEGMIALETDLLSPSQATDPTIEPVVQPANLTPTPKPSSVKTVSSTEAVTALTNPVAPVQLSNSTSGGSMSSTSDDYDDDEYDDDEYDDDDYDDDDYDDDDDEDDEDDD